MSEADNLAAFWSKLNDSHRKSGMAWSLKPRTENWLQDLLAALFPHYWREGLGSCDSIWHLVGGLQSEVVALLELTGLEEERAKQIADKFWAELPDIYSKLLDDAVALEQHDPAANSVEEVMLAYPGFLAITCFRLAHQLQSQGVFLVPRLMTEWAHRHTGIDIHPGAEIGSPFVIDHGTGVVIGETAKIGRGVKLYQGVTLGAMSVKKEQAEIKRHPTIEDDVVVYAGAAILGGKTTIGRGSIIAGGAFLTSSVPENSLVTRTSEVRPLGKGALSEFLAFGENI